jgi:hypothetical protein
MAYYLEEDHRGDVGFISAEFCHVRLVRETGSPYVVLCCEDPITSHNVPPKTRNSSISTPLPSNITSISNDRSEI